MNAAETAQVDHNDMIQDDDPNSTKTNSRSSADKKKYHKSLSLKRFFNNVKSSISGKYDQLPVSLVDASFASAVKKSIGEEDAEEPLDMMYVDACRQILKRITNIVAISVIDRTVEQLPSHPKPKSQLDAKIIRMEISFQPTPTGIFHPGKIYHKTREVVRPFTEFRQLRKLLAFCVNARRHKCERELVDGGECPFCTQFREYEAICWELTPLVPRTVLVSGISKKVLTDSLMNFLRLATSSSVAMPQDTVARDASSPRMCQPQSEITLILHDFLQCTTITATANIQTTNIESLSLQPPTA